MFLLSALSNVFAVSDIDSLKSEVNIARNNSKVDILNQISDYYLKSNTDSAILYSNEAYRYSSIVKYRIGEVSALNNLAFAYYIKNNVDSAKTYASQALDLSRSYEYNLGKAQSLNILGLAEWRIGAYPNAVEMYLQALDYAILADNKIEISKSNNYLGLVYWKSGDYPKSIDYLFKSLELKEELKDNYEVALTLNNLSNVHNEIGDYEQAILFAERALKISEETNSKYTLGRALGNIGIGYLKMDETEKALKYLNRSLKVKEESGEIKGLGYTLIDVGNIYFQIGNESRATEYYNKALKIMTDIDDAHGLSIVLTKIARTEFSNRKFNKAITLLNESSKYAKRENLRENLKENFLLYSKIYEQQGRTLNALEYFKLHSALKDSLINEKTNSQIMELNINYETNQKEKENELLKQKNIIQSLELETQKQYIYFLLAATLLGIILIGGIILRYRYLSKTKKITEEKNIKIEKQRIELEQLNATKDKFFSILAHDLKNPFQTVLGFSNMLSTDYHELSDEDKQKIVSQILNVSKSSYQLLENLLGWANTQTGRIEYSPQEYNLLSITNDSLEHVKMQAEQKFQQIDVKINPEYKVRTDHNIFSAVLRNLVTNAVKFSKIKGKVIIDAFEKDENIIVTVEDNGTGIPKNQLDNLFILKTSKNSKGTAAESGTGLGLVICREFVEIYGGKIWVESELGKGSKFYFTLRQA
jgi:signal transduction histidine kinase/tetratricopeptide (TPR) repeat protein